MDFNTVPWYPGEIYVISCLALAGLVTLGFPVQYLFSRRGLRSGRWRRDRAAIIIFCSKLVLAFTLNAAWLLQIALHAGFEMSLVAGNIFACSVYLAIAVSQAAMWMWMSSVMRAPEKELV